MKNLDVFARMKQTMLLGFAIIMILLTACEKANVKNEPTTPLYYEFAIRFRLVNPDYNRIYDDQQAFYKDSINDLNPPYFINLFGDTTDMRISGRPDADGLVLVASKMDTTVYRNIISTPDTSMTWHLHWNSTHVDTIIFSRFRYDFEFGPRSLPTGVIEEFKEVVLNGDTIYQYDEPVNQDSTFLISPSILIKYP